MIKKYSHKRPRRLIFLDCLALAIDGLFLGLWIDNIWNHRVLLAIFCGAGLTTSLTIKFFSYVKYRTEMAILDDMIMQTQSILESHLGVLKKDPSRPQA